MHRLQIMILVGNNVQASGDITPDAKDYNDYRVAVRSIILR
jgi:hypothetical protein